MSLARAAKRLKRFKTAMGGYWKKLAWIWVWRHVRLGSAPCRLGIGGTMSTAMRVGLGWDFGMGARVATQTEKDASSIYLSMQ